MSKIEELKQLMSIDACNTVPDIQQHFDHIAKLLFECFVIEYEGSRYLFKDIEFYYYNKNHRDIITHPRCSKAMQWYINDFGGIDLNFESSIKFNIIINDKKKSSKRYLLDDNASFGGILLRKLEKDDGSEILDGPWACAELFRSFNAVSADNGFPRLIRHDNANVAYVCEKRKNLRTKQQTIEKKVGSIITQFASYPEFELLCSDFEIFENKRYRYVRCENLMHDSDTNEVYFSTWLKDKQEGHPEFYHRLIDLLNGIGITTKELYCTEDYWARDYMPIQLGKEEFVK